jgi:hypothetical protein
MTEPTAPGPQRVRSLRELPQAIEPPRDLWPQIAARLEQESPAAAPRAPQLAPRRTRMPLQWLAAAAMVASVAVGVWIGRDLLPGKTPIQVVANHPVPGTAQPATVQPGMGSAVEAAYVNDPRYQRQRQALLQSLQAQLATMPPETREKVLASLATIDKAKQDLESALGKDPGNALLQELLVNTYQDEMRVLTQVHEANNSGEGI